MKFNPRSGRVWLTYIVAGFNLLFGIALAVFSRRSNQPARVLLYGHHFNGNIRAFHDHADWRAAGLDCRFLYIDHAQYRKYKDSSPWLLSSRRIDHMIWAASADAIIADRGLGLLGVLKRLRPQTKTVQVWHGVGYKGFSPDHFEAFRKFSLSLVASEAVRDEWHDGGKGPPLDRLVVTGFARTDSLVNPSRTRADLERAIALETTTRARVLFAPTWQQDDSGRSLVPFGMSGTEFIREIDEWATSRSVEVIFRMHLNTKALREPGSDLDLGTHRSVFFRSMSDYPLTEDLLMVSDVLVTDWSSVAADFLVLDRPIVFLDVPAPFRHGFSVLGADDRPGPKARTMRDLLTALDETLGDPPAALQSHAKSRARVKKKAFDDTLDGRSSARYLEAVVALIEPSS